MDISKKSIKIGLVQTSCVEQPDENLYKQMGLIRKAAEEGAQIVCLQELFNTIYFPAKYDDKYFKWAQPKNGPLTKSLSELAKELSIIIIAPFFEKRTNGIYHNSLFVINEKGEIQGGYRKMHIPDDPGFYEKYYFTPGDEETGFGVFDTSCGRIGTLICWDQWYPEAARITALKGAEIIFYPTAIGTLNSERKKEQEEFHQAWETIQRSHAIANGCFVVSVNRVGKESGTKFWGGSFVAGPFGQIIAKAGSKEEVLVTEIDLNNIEKQRQTWPFFRDRRIDMYKPILKRIEID